MEQLLKILENNARLPVEDIATMLNKSPAEVAAMMDLARAQGIIKGYKTLVDWEKAKVNRVEAVIELNVSPKKSRGSLTGGRSPRLWRFSNNILVHGIPAAAAGASPHPAGACLSAIGAYIDGF